MKSSFSFITLLTISKTRTDIPQPRTSKRTIITSLSEKLPPHYDSFKTAIQFVHVRTTTTTIIRNRSRRRRWRRRHTPRRNWCEQCWSRYQPTKYYIVSIKKPRNTTGYCDNWSSFRYRFIIIFTIWWWVNKAQESIRKKMSCIKPLAYLPSYLPTVPPLPLLQTRIKANCK